MNIIKLFTRSKQAFYFCANRTYSLKIQDPLKLSETEWDVIISGGGMVGCALACSLG